MPPVSADREYPEPQNILVPSLVATVSGNHERFEVIATLAPYTVPIVVEIVERFEVRTNPPAPMASSLNDVPERSKVEDVRLCVTDPSLPSSSYN